MDEYDQMQEQKQRILHRAEEDRKYMGSAADAREALAKKAREFRELRQPSMDTAKNHRDRERREHQVRFELANAALHWLWHEENPEPTAQ